MPSFISGLREQIPTVLCFVAWMLILPIEVGAQVDQPSSPQLSSLQRLLQNQPFIASAMSVPVVRVSRYTCPGGQQVIQITNPICQPPVMGSCTAYWCIDAATGQMTLAQPVSPFYPNPLCQQDQMQTEPCSNDPGEPKAFMPSREQLIEALPALFPKKYLEVPFLAGGK